MSELIDGPWEYIAKLSGSENHRGFSVFDSKGWAFAQVMPVDIGGERGKARARLIAAAPKLLAALQDARQWLPTDVEVLIDDRRIRIIDLVDDAIAEAIGENG